jgi:hypothetical protein
LLEEISPFPLTAALREGMAHEIFAG